MQGKTPVLEGQTREHTGSKYAIRARRAGKLPAVIYGHQKDPAHVALDLEEATEVLHAGAHLVEVSLDSGRKETCLIKAVQYDHLGDSLIHMDLARVDLSEEVTVSVPLVFAGQEACPGLKEAGAFLDHPMTDLEVICRADAIPNEVAVDVSQLKAGEVVTVGDLTLPAGVKAGADAEAVVASVQVLAEEPEGVEAVEAGEGAEPEVIAEKKEAAEGEDK